MNCEYSEIDFCCTECHMEHYYELVILRIRSYPIILQPGICPGIQDCYSYILLCTWSALPTPANLLLSDI